MSQLAVREDLYKRVYSFVVRRISNREDALDVVQEIFLKMHEGEKNLRNEDFLLPWLYRIARNQVVDYFRGRGKPPPFLPEAFEALESPVSKEVAGWLKFFLEQMDPRDREILSLVEFGGKTQKEAGAELGITLQASKARHQRAKKRLRAALEKCCRYTLDSRGSVIDYERKGGRDCC